MMKISEGPEQWQKIAGGVALGVGVLALLFLFTRSHTEALEKPHEEHKKKQKQKEEKEENDENDEKDEEKICTCMCPRILPCRRKQEWQSEADIKKECRKRQKKKIKELIRTLEQDCDED